MPQASAKQKIFEYVPPALLNISGVYSESYGTPKQTSEGIRGSVTMILPLINKQTNNNDLLEKDGGTKNCIYKD